MMADIKNPDDHARWEQLVEAQACGELSEAERSELAALAARNGDRRRELQLLHALSKLPPLDTDRSEEDDQLIEDVLAQHGQRHRRRRRVRWSAAAVVLIPLTAAAGYMIRGGRADEPPLQTSPMAQPSPIAPSVKEMEADGHLPEPEPASEPLDTSPPRSDSRTPSPSAAELLARAQKARSARNYARALQAYEQLLRRYPQGGEAQLARLSLAQLRLAQGEAAAALGGFDAYERSGGALAQEAHYGKIQALRALRRTAEERIEIQRFLAVYPHSLQVGALKRRLEAADGEE